ncbi:hypothetical protein AB0G67_45100, partial [Streptomyces sp. NPDC021056]
VRALLRRRTQTDEESQILSFADVRLDPDRFEAWRGADPLVGRHRPNSNQVGGRGLWLTHQLCDLVEIHSAPATGTTIRLHTELTY